MEMMIMRTLIIMINNSVQKSFEDEWHDQRKKLQSKCQTSKKLEYAPILASALATEWPVARISVGYNSEVATQVAQDEPMAPIRAIIDMKGKTSTETNPINNTARPPEISQIIYCIEFNKLG